MLVNGLYKYRDICFNTTNNFGTGLTISVFAEEQKEQMCMVLTMFVGGDGHP